MDTIYKTGPRDQSHLYSIYQGIPAHTDSLQNNNFLMENLGPCSHTEYIEMQLHKSHIE